MSASISTTPAESEIITIKSLRSLVGDHRVVSIIGNAKNAGKTTVLNKLIETLKGSRIGITSIGFDGERLDTISFHQKPRITAYPHMFVATAERALEAATAKYVIHQRTDIRTALGNIVVMEILEEGLVLVAGPSARRDMIRLMKEINKYDLQHMFIDGALFRKSIANSFLSSAIIFVTGASYSSNMDETIHDTKIMIDQLQIEQAKDPSYQYENMNENTVYVYEKGISKTDIRRSYVGHEYEIDPYLTDTLQQIVITGALTDRMAERLILHKSKINEITLIVQDASYVLVSPNVHRNLEHIGVKIKAVNPIEILFVACNPVSPSGYSYEKNQFIAKLREELRLPVINVLQDLG